jgi:RNA polymerase sigma-70 factor (ECF subfamily)
MDPLDREVLALRHFEKLSNSECASVLGFSETSAMNRYLRALERLTEILSTLPGGWSKRPGHEPRQT